MIRQIETDTIYLEHAATTPVDPEPNPRAVKLLEDPEKTEEYTRIITELLAVAGK